MNSKTAGYLIFYGAFLIFMGLLGYLSNPEKAKTALMSGGTFGALSILWGVLERNGIGGYNKAATLTTGLLSLVFAWRSTKSWQAVSEGKSEKLFAAILITVMLVGSVLMLLCLLRARKPADGRILTGKQALQHGLVDKFGNFDFAVEETEKPTDTNS